MNNPRKAVTAKAARPKSDRPYHLEDVPCASPQALSLDFAKLEEHGLHIVKTPTGIALEPMFRDHDAFERMQESLTDYGIDGPAEQEEAFEAMHSIKMFSALKRAIK